MALAVGDQASNANENIAHAAKIIGRSQARLAVFSAIYTGKKRLKTAAEISASTGMNIRRTLTEAKKLTDNHLATPTKVNGLKAYEKIDFFHTHKTKILSLAKSPEKLNSYPTKRNSNPSQAKTTRLKLALTIPNRKQLARRISVDDIASFALVKKIKRTVGYTKISEARFKQGVARILGEKGKFKDWGGESRDLFSTRLKLRTTRLAVAFAFKGPGMTGRLTPGKMGKNGDQIQRLMKCPAQVFLIQYWSQMDDSVLEQLESLCQLQSYFQSRSLWYGIIDGVDSTRLIQAYPKLFK